MVQQKPLQWLASLVVVGSKNIIKVLLVLFGAQDKTTYSRSTFVLLVLDMTPQYPAKVSLSLTAGWCSPCAVKFPYVKTGAHAHIHNRAIKAQMHYACAYTIADGSFQLQLHERQTHRTHSASTTPAKRNLHSRRPAHKTHQRVRMMTKFCPVLITRVVLLKTMTYVFVSMNTHADWFHNSARHKHTRTHKTCAHEEVERRRDAAHSHELVVKWNELVTYRSTCVHICVPYNNCGFHICVSGTFAFIK